MGSRFVTSLPYFENKEIEQVESFKYLGSTVNAESSIGEEINEQP